MIKTILLITLSLLATVFISLLLLIAYIGWGALKQPPAHALIVEKYYACHGAQALHGGIFGKGPTKRFFKPDLRQWCWRWQWVEIERAEFQHLATHWYGVNWDDEGEWWSLGRR